jgi:hypothetical protein
MFPSIYIVYTYYIGLDNTLYTFDVPLICLPHFPGTSACSHHRLGGIGACGSFHALWLGAKPKRQVLKKWEMPLPLSDFKDFYLNLEVTIYICMWYIYIYTSYTIQLYPCHTSYLPYLLDHFLHLWEMPPPWGRSVQFVNAQASFVRVPSKRSCPCVQSICIYIYM